MKKLLLKITFIYWGFVGVFTLFSKQDKDLNTSFPSEIVKMVRNYSPLKPRNIKASDFFKDISQFDYADTCKQFTMDYEWSVFYPSEGLFNNEIKSDSVLPSFELEYENFASSLIKERIKPVIDSMYLNGEYQQHEFRIESHYPVRYNLTEETYYQQLNLKIFEPDNPHFYGLVSEPVEAFDGARIELNYELLGSLKDKIFIDENKPLKYEIKSTADTVSHIFTFSLKDHQCSGVQAGIIDLSIIPPPHYDYSHITKSKVGDLIYVDNIPLLVAAFENGMLHLVYDSRAIEFYPEDFYFYKNGKFLDSKTEGTIIDFSSYHIFRNNAHMNAEALCNEVYSGDNLHKFKRDVLRISYGVYYEVLILSLGCDPDEIYIAKQRSHSYDDILGSRIVLFGLDTEQDGYKYKYELLKKDEYGTLRALHKDTTRTEPTYEDLHEELMEYTTYPISANMRNEVIVRVQVMVHKDGTMTDVKLYSDPGDPLLDEDALNAVKSLKSKWKPATLHGESIDLGVIIPICYEKR